MIPSAFEYHAPATLEEAVGLLAQYGEDAKILSGGHSLIPLLKTRIARLGIAVDIGRIRDLSDIREESGVCRIGACATHYLIESSDVLNRCCPLLPQVAAQIGDVQVRNKGSIGGSLAHADPAADYPAAAIALRASLVAVGPKGEREIPIDDFFLGPLATSLAPDEILKEVRIPDAGAACAYRKVAQRASGFAVVGIAVQLALDDGRCTGAGVGVTGLADHAFRATGVEEGLAGRVLDEAAVEAAAAKAAGGVKPLEDLFASSNYRAHLARVHCRRAIQAALA
ncbi:MAG: FAD binding domain-containing protein [Nitrospinota bacterium]